jgi:hypothetical protein
MVHIREIERGSSLENKNFENKLVILWTSADKEVALTMMFMYAINAKLNGWWDEVTVIVWGPSAKLLSKDAELQIVVQEAQDKGIKFQACIACADIYGVTEKLKALHIETIKMGVPLTNYLKSGARVISL